MLIKHASEVFEFGEKEEMKRILTSEIIAIKYCAYCGEKAKSKDYGSTHNHRWEEDIVYYCECEKAQKEIELKTELSNINNKKFHLENEIKKLQESEKDSLLIRKIKAEKEIQQIKRKYKLNDEGANL